MSNEIREKDHEWVKNVHSNFDRLLASLEKLLSKQQPSVFNDELLTDKEVAHLLKVSRRTLQDYRNNGILPYTQVGGKILYRTSDIERTLMKGYKEAYRLK
ncbi:helix-turn-helix domain-containing protein [Paraprevotella clara]|uniref:DNA binding domain, excisionase family n=1 Tax=Paraprevotella clara YIT 11840 TaxID=762968 RepID=G5ST08_9BACT|nr:helix-turn-helix domain-containing protein [Paraprevotella clara]EHG99795.1 DNA binding domain, excisionase family [Paraprevotella clara YIT 11840]